MKDAANDLILFAGSGNPALTRLIAAQTRFPVSDSVVERFPDGETSVRLLRPVRGKQVFVIQPTSPPVNDHLIELACFADACRRAAAEKVILSIGPLLGAAIERIGTSRSVSDLFWNAGDERDEMLEPQRNNER